MAIIPLDKPLNTSIPPVLRLGFRPFFLLAGIISAIFLAIWLFSFTDGFMPAPIYNPVLWHAHEMIFGYTAAVIAGFLLTAVKNWTGIQTIRGYWLAELTSLWLAGRILPFFDIHPLFAAAISVAFFPFLAFAIAVPLIRSGNKTNLVFIPVLLMFACSELIFQLSILDLIELDAMNGIHLAMHMTIILIVLMGGRVIPFFIGRSTVIQLSAIPRTIDQATFISLILWTFSSLVFGWNSPAAALFAAVAAMFQGYRMIKWHTSKLWSIPMLWILYLGYSWIFTGLVIQTLSYFIPVMPSVSIHAMTTGAIGMVTMGMMSRVSLGHTGRNIDHNNLLLIAFLLIAITPVLRVLLPALIPGIYHQAVIISGLSWIVAFTLFSIVLAPILIKPREDGRDG